MELSGIAIQNGGGRDSLALSIQALLRWRGFDVDCDEITASLGMTFRTPAVKRRVCLGAWTDYGCDALLPEAALLLGLRLREIHPPQAAVGLSRFEPFAQHFEASYAPLIQRALHHDQPVLAWQGWPTKRQSPWGIITREGTVGCGFAGAVAGTSDNATPIVSPPVQLYVVEEISPKRPSNERLLRSTVRSALCILRRDGLADPDVVLGEQAYSLWLRRLEAAAMCATCGDCGWRCHHAHTLRLTSNREAAMRVLEQCGSEASIAVQSAIHDISVGLRGYLDALATSRDPAAVELLGKTYDGRAALAAGIRKAQSMDDRVLQSLSRLADCIE